MESIIVAAVVTLVPVALAQFIRANAGAMFLAGCGGIVLLSTLDPVLVTTAGAFIPMEGESVIRVFVVVTTIVIAALLFKNTVEGLRSILNVFTSLFLGLLLLLQLPALTGFGMLVSLIKETWWQDINAYSSLIVIAGLGFSLSMVITKKHAAKKSKSKH